VAANAPAAVALRDTQAAMPCFPVAQGPVLLSHNAQRQQVSNFYNTGIFGGFEKCVIRTLRLKADDARKKKSPALFPYRRFRPTPLFAALTVLRSALLLVRVFFLAPASESGVNSKFQLISCFHMLHVKDLF
jgi:hypothetical protein